MTPAAGKGPRGKPKGKRRGGGRATAKRRARARVRASRPKQKPKRTPKPRSRARRSAVAQKARPAAPAARKTRPRPKAVVRKKRGATVEPILEDAFNTHERARERPIEQRRRPRQAVGKMTAHHGDRHPFARHAIFESRQPALIRRHRFRPE